MNREQLIEAEVFKIESTHHFHGDTCLCGFSSARSRSRTEHITGLIRAVFEEAHTPTGPAFIAIMPPSPETSQRWYSMYCRVCGIEEMMAETADDPRLIARRDGHNRTMHTPTDDEREAAFKAVANARECADGGCEEDRKIAEGFLAAGFRRTVQDEPTDAQEVEFPFALGNVTLEQEDGGMWVVITETPRNRTYWIEPGVLVALRAAFNETGESR